MTVPEDNNKKLNAEDSEFDSVNKNPRVDDLLSAHLDALFAGAKFDPESGSYGLNADELLEVDDLLPLAERLGETLVAITPSEEFVQRLKGDLVGGQQSALLLRWRQLPPQYRLAARLGGLTLTAGLAFLAAGRVFSLKLTHGTGSKSKLNDPDAGLVNLAP